MDILRPEFQHPLRVYIEDTDAGGIVYYVNYLKFMERARTEYLRSLNFEHYLLSGDDYQFVVHSAEIQYLRPARMDDALIATAQIMEIHRASLIFKQKITRDMDILCTATIKIACISSSTLRPRALPEKLRNLL